MYFRFPVLAFTGAPASFPVQEENVNLQKYLMHNSKWINKAKLWIKNNLPKGIRYLPYSEKY